MNHYKHNFLVLKNILSLLLLIFIFLYQSKCYHAFSNRVKVHCQKRQNNCANYEDDINFNLEYSQLRSPFCLKIYIKSDKIIYKTNDAIHIEVKIVNLSDSFFYVYNLLIPSYNLIFDIIDEKGNIIKYIDYCGGSYPSREACDYLFMPPNDFFGSTFDLNTECLFPNLPEGSLKIKVKFKGKIKPEIVSGSANKDLIENIWVGQIESDEIKINLE